MEIARSEVDSEEIALFYTNGMSVPDESFRKQQRGDDWCLILIWQREGEIDELLTNERTDRL